MNNVEFEKFYNKYRIAAINTAFSYVRNWHISEELAHDAFIKFYDKYYSFKGEAKDSTWFYSILKNICLNYLRSFKTMKRHGKTVSIESIYGNIPDDKKGPLQLVIDNEMKEKVEIFFKIKKNKCIKTVRLYYLSDLSPDSICESVGFDKSRLRHRVFRGLQMLKNGQAERLRCLL